MVKHVKLLSIRVSLSACLLFNVTTSFGQVVVNDALVFKEEITSFSQDRTGNIFLAFKGGAISKYSPTLDSLVSFSPNKIGDITLLEAWHGFQIFSFYADFQEFILLDRFLTRATRYQLSETSSVYADICSISSDQNLWVFEENQLRLLKVNLNIREIDIETPLEFLIDAEDHNIVFIREYQNLLFLADELTGIYVFDNLGNYLRRIDAPGIKGFSFKDDLIYYLQNNQIHKINLYQGNHKIMNLTESNDYLGVLPLEESMLLVKKNKVFTMLAKFD